MYVRAKMVSVETFPKTGGEEGKIKENDRGGDFKHNMCDTLLRTIGNATMYSLPAQQ
jgi:hypothetical protein